MKEEEFSEYEFVVFGEQDSADIRQWSGDRLKNNDTQEMVWGRESDPDPCSEDSSLQYKPGATAAPEPARYKPVSKAKNTDAQTW